MSTSRCSSCGKPDVHAECVPEYATRVRGVPVTIKNAMIERCAGCGAVTVSARELERWEGEQRRALQDGSLIPRPADLKQLRSSLGLSASDFAVLFGVSRQTVHAWERVESGGMQYGPAAILLQLLIVEQQRSLEGLFTELVRAAQARGQEVNAGRHGGSGECPGSGTRPPSGALRHIPAGAPGNRKAAA